MFRRFQALYAVALMSIMVNISQGQDTNGCQDLSLHGCGNNATCENQTGSYYCLCNSGYSGDGQTCADINECVTTDACGDNAICNNNDGSFTCSCLEGFIENGNSCVEAFEVLCSAEYIIVSVSSEYYTNQGVDLIDLHLSDVSCGGSEDPSSANIWIFNTTTLSSCSTSLLENSTHIIYSNTINNIGSSGVYHGDRVYNTFSCVYEKQLGVVSLFDGGYSVISNLKNLTTPSGLGEVSTELNLYTDSTHSTPDDRTQFSINETLYIMIKVRASPPNITLVIDRCWITEVPILNYEFLFVFIENGCPVEKHLNDVQITASGIGSVASFESPVFASIDYDIIYLHCSLQLCSLAGGGSCTPACDVSKRSLPENLFRRKRQSNQDGYYSDIATLSVGPFAIIRDDGVVEPDPYNHNEAELQTTTLIAVLGSVLIVVAALLVLAGFWFKLRYNPVATKKLDFVAFRNPTNAEE